MELKNSAGFGLLFEMGCGKTLTAIAIAGSLYKAEKIARLLVIAPTSVVAVWPREFDESANFRFSCRALLGTKEKRIQELKSLEAFRLKALKVAVINYESTWREGIYEALEEYNADMIICDESQRIKTHDAEQSKAIHRLGDQARYKMILSGTPVQNNAIDIWSQYRFLDPTVFGRNFYVFKNHYCIMGGFNNKQIIGYKDLKTLIRKEHSIAFRVTKEEAIDLPEQTFETRYIEMNKKERDLYQRLRIDSMAELTNGEKITATTVLTKLLRLQQLTGGFLVTDGGTTPELVSRSKLDAIADIIQDYVLEENKKLVIFARFIPEVYEILKTAEKLLGPKKKKVVSIYGAIKKEDRGPIIEQFQTDPDTMVIVGQIDTLGVGVTLTAADTCVYYSKNFNYATYEQSLSRIHRIGQRNRCTYIDLVVKGTVDERITEALGNKQDLAHGIVDNWRDIFGGNE